MRRKEKEGGGIKRKGEKETLLYEGRTHGPIPGTSIILPLNPMGLQLILVSIFWNRFNSRRKRKTRQQKSRGFDDRSETQRDRNLVGTFVVRVHTICCTTRMLEVCQGAEKRPNGGNHIVFMTVSFFPLTHLSFQ